VSQKPSCGGVFRRKKKADSGAKESLIKGPNSSAIHQTTKVREILEPEGTVQGRLTNLSTASENIGGGGGKLKREEAMVMGHEMIGDFKGANGGVRV